MEACTQFVGGDANLLLAEIMTLNKAIDIAKDCCFVETHFEIDNENLARMMNGEKENRTTAGMVILAMKRKLKDFRRTKVSFGRRSCNKAAHLLAKKHKNLFE